MYGTYSKLAFILDPLIDIKIAKTDISFLTLETLNIYKHNKFSCYSFNG